MESPMPTAYAAFTSSFAHKASRYHLSPDLTAVLVFSFIGLAASAALIASMGSNAIAFVLGAF
jgi:hypothetical protein